MKKKYDFSGWATRNDLLCSDGRTIRKNAFVENNGKIVPLVWQHMHDDPENVLGHALLENRPEGVYTYGFFNDSKKGQEAKLLVEHGDVTSLSIYANQLKEQSGNVFHGNIREVSLVLAGANPGACIDTVGFSHSDEDQSFEAVIYTENEYNYIPINENGMIDVADEVEAETPSEDTIAHSDSEEAKSDDDNKGDNKMSEAKEKTVQDVFDELTEEQKNVVYFLIGEAVKGKGEKEDEEVEHSDNGGDEMKYNVFEGEEKNDEVLMHDGLNEILKDAKRQGSLKESFLAHAAEYGIENIDYLFPEAQALEKTPDFIKREDSWVDVVMKGVHHTPFSRIKSMHADITADEARARGYIKGNLKKEEVISLLKRSTTPTTIYKKQKLDRDDIIDITDFDVVSWLKTEMRMMLDEEIARAILIGDGRPESSDDKIQELNIRPIAKDAAVYAIHHTIDAAITPEDLIDEAVRAKIGYKGSGSPTAFMTEALLTDMLLLKDEFGHRMYKNASEVATAMSVSRIVTVPVMDGFSYTKDGNTISPKVIIVNLNDYNVGADKGGAVNMFDDFDIDYNQQKYLIETRCSGALTKPFSAIILETVASN